MKKLFQNAVLPFVIFTSGILLIGCDQSPQSSGDQSEQAEVEAVNPSDSTIEKQTSSTPTELKSGNMFYIARDVASVQLKTGDYVAKLQQLQSDLQQAIDTKNQQHLQQTAQDLRQQLRGFNTALISLELKSQEIDAIRQQVIQANQQMLKSSFLNGDLDLSQVDFKKIEKQMNNIQMDMLKLASMLIP
ncbi:hypothetical protein [Acinetobacter sp. ANC 4648]|uniref:hypothetical protein n=1 Tax=Acinetobacter sp. ANC 4648 TaxID=1977875 RepID=UPI000A33C09A|nr:hypothetical protein [Acinetobacter sp. ANC 4648]OTG85250.1 hypothetical protein B9T27_02635 [Acinetobacter sp. ANC 4648]